MQEQMQKQEVTLREYIDVTIKRKWIIITVFFGTIIVAAIVNLLMPKIYEVSMIIKPGIIEVTDSGKAIYLDSTENMKAKTEKVIFYDKITKILDLDPGEGIADFKILRITNTNPEILKISIERQEERIPSGIKILNQLFEQLRLTSQEIVDSEHDKIEKQISGISDDIAAKNNEINLEQEAQKEKLVLLKEKEKQLSLLIQLLQSYTTKTFNKISALLEKAEGLNKRGALSKESETLGDSVFQSYVKTIRQNMQYTNELQAELDNLNRKKSSMIAEIKKLQKAVKPLTMEIEELNLKKDNISNVKLIQKPEVSSLPTTSKKRQNVTLAGILGLILGTLLAFFMEKRK